MWKIFFADRLHFSYKMFLSVTVHINYPLMESLNPDDLTHLARGIWPEILDVTFTCSSKLETTAVGICLRP